ncbi:MAG: hypothetical protein ABIO39_13690 [Caulobacteraceae bacterium]
MPGDIGSIANPLPPEAGEASFAPCLNEICEIALFISRDSAERCSFTARISNTNAAFLIFPETKPTVEKCGCARPYPGPAALYTRLHQNLGGLFTGVEKFSPFIGLQPIGVNDDGGEQQSPQGGD